MPEKGGLGSLQILGGLSKKEGLVFLKGEIDNLMHTVMVVGSDWIFCTWKPP